MAPAMVWPLLACVLWLTLGTGGIAAAETAPSSAMPPVREMPPGDWRRLRSAGGRGEAPRALAVAADGVLATGDDGGATRWRGGASARAVLSPVGDLAFDADGVLWIGSEDGLYRWASDEVARPVRRVLRGGEGSQRVHRVVASGSALLVATDAGAYWSSSGRVFQTLRGGSASGPVARVAIRPPKRAGTVEVWLLGADGLFRVRGLPAASGLRVVDRSRIDLPRPGDDRLPIDLVIDPAGSRLALVYADVIAWRPLGAGAPGPATWRIVRPVLPPGAAIRRLEWADGGVLLATDHGLLEGPRLDAVLRRVPSGAGRSDCVDVAADRARGALALCRAGLFGRRSTALVTAPGSGPLRSVRAASLPPDPPLAAIRRQALARSGLGHERGRKLWRGLRRRAWLPEVELRFGIDHETDRVRDRDQSFVSGDTRRLLDRSDDESHGYAASIALDWDLGGIAYPDDSVDLSRELRQVLTLRDDVADEIHQLYTERQRIRGRLDSGDPPPEAEARELRLRAQEIDAGLDAWTDGWISRWRARPGRGERPSQIHPVEKEGWNEWQSE